MQEVHVMLGPKAWVLKVLYWDVRYLQNPQALLQLAKHGVAFRQVCINSKMTSDPSRE